MSATIEDAAIDELRLSLKKRLQLDSTDQQVLKPLMQPNPLRFMVWVLIHLSVWLLGAWAVFAFDNIWVSTFCALVLSSQLHALTVLQHDCGHGNAFRSIRYDLWMGRLLAWFIFMPFTTFKECHRRHHRYFGGELDPDDWHYQGGLVGLVLRIGTFVPRFTYISLTQYGASIRNRVIFELLLNLSSALVVLWLFIISHALEEFLFIFVLPMFLLGFVINPIFRGYEHFPLVFLDPEDKDRVNLAKTTITVPGKLIGLLWGNINYHVEHHLYPGVPFFNLPQLSQLLTGKPYMRDKMVLEQLFNKQKFRALNGFSKCESSDARV